MLPSTWQRQTRLRCQSINKLNQKKCPYKAVAQITLGNNQANTTYMVCNRHAMNCYKEGNVVSYIGLYELNLLLQEQEVAEYQSNQNRQPKPV